MSDTLDKIWEELSEIVVHLTVSTVVIILTGGEYLIISKFIHLFALEDNFYVSFLKNASAIVLIILYLIHVSKIVMFKLKELRDDYESTKN